MVERGNLTTGVSVQRIERDNKIISGWSEKAPITFLGIEYLNGRSTSTMNQTNYNITNSSLVGLFSMGKITSRNRKSRGLSLNENLSAM